LPARRFHRDGNRALSCWQQAKFILAWFRDGPDIRRLGQGSGISRATACRYKDEGIEVLKAGAPDSGAKSLLIGWAGWDHREQAGALSWLIGERSSTDG
jgi:hypothetical protein